MSRHRETLAREPIGTRHYSVSVLDTSPPTPVGLLERSSDSLLMDDYLMESPGSVRHRRGSEFGGGFARLKPVAMRPGERTVSTSMRLRRQGFTMSKSGLNNFAVKSIRRGSDEWNGLLRPFVSDLVFRSLEYRWSQSEVSFRPYSCQAAVLFVDLSNYSKITAELGQRGAHSISTVVNAYLGRLLHIVNQYGGDVAKFAGDAVLIVWEGAEEDLEINVITAAKCAVDLQQNAGTHEIDGASSSFRIHCGLCYGQLESEIFAAPNHVNMQHLYHSVGGESLVELSELVEIANAGEICIADTCLKYLDGRGTFKEVEGTNTCLLLTDMNLDESTANRMESHLEQVLSDRLLRRNQKIEEEFIHPSVIRLLSHGGLSPTQISQMRNLCVIFIAMTSNGSSINWLMEVQSILDKNRCPIVQIIDDDKGVHIVAAVNLYESVPETGLTGLAVCCELVGQQVGCAIGMAQGSTFCGVTGSSSVACRWDITGPPAVRAARLMQYALKSGVEVAIDQSVYNDSMAATKMALLETGVSLKGTQHAISVYTISDAKFSSAFRILETEQGRVHDSLVHSIVDHINSAGTHRCAVLVTGLPMAGKKIVCQRAAGMAGLVPYLHVSDDCAGFLQLARSIATWFQYVDKENVRSMACEVVELVEQRKWSRAHDECVALVNLAISVGLRACFLIDRVQFLDDFSISLIRECLPGRSNHRFRGSTSHLSESLSQLGIESERSSISGNHGQVCFLLVHVSHYNLKSAAHIAADITRSHKTLVVPIVKVGEASPAELLQLFMDLADINVDDRWLDAMVEASGNCAGYFVERAAALKAMSEKLWSEGKEGYVEVSNELVACIPAGSVRRCKQVPVRQISAEVAMRFSQVFDGLPPLLQTFNKVLAVASKTGFYKLHRQVLWEVLNDLIADGVENGVYNVVIDELTELGLIKVTRAGTEDILSFQCPALCDIAFDVSTPVQVQCIGHALIERLEAIQMLHFTVPFVIANLHHLVGDEDDEKEAKWTKGYEMFENESKDWEMRNRCKWKEALDEEVAALGGIRDSGVQDNDVRLPCIPTITAISEQMKKLRSYVAPLTLGPMGHTLSVICRNVFHEFGVFSESASAEAAAALRSDSRSAAERYLLELNVVETFLADHGFPATKEELQHEQKQLLYFSESSVSEHEVQQKAATILKDFVPRHVCSRLQRLYALVDKLRGGEIPGFVQRSDGSIRLAYAALQSDKCRLDATQDALMCMASQNWKPKRVPEFLPLLCYQTVCRIRNKILKLLSETELDIYKHKLTHVDLEAFLIVTPLLYEAQDRGEC